MDPLIREYLRGSERAKDLLVQRYCPDEKSLRKRFPDLDPGDALSEAMLAIDRALPGVDWGNAPSAYLAGAVNERLRSKERDARRRAGKEGPSLDTPVGDDGASLGELLGSDSPAPDDVALLNSDLAPVLSRLCKRQRRVYYLHEGARLCVPMIASQLDVSQLQVRESLEGAKTRVASLTKDNRMFSDNVESKVTLLLPSDYKEALDSLAAVEGTNASEFLRAHIRREARRRLKLQLPQSRRPGRAPRKKAA